MKKLVYFFLFTLLFSCTKNENHTFTVNGTLQNSNGKTIFLEEDMEGSLQPVVVDSALVKKDGTFKLTGTAKEQTMFSLRTDKEMIPFALLVNDSKQVTINADPNNKNAPYIVKGSPASQAIIDYDKNIDQKADNIARLGKNVDTLIRSKASDSIIKLNYQPYTVALDDLRNYTLDQVNKSNSPVLTLYVIGSYQRMTENLGIKSFSQTELSALINKASSKFPDHTALIAIKNKLKPRKAPDFTLPDTTGKPVSLSSFKGKYVLVDFWASWCQPCREENPNVVKAYNQFRNKNFTILGVSLDKEKDSWEKAIHDDGLAWNQVSDLKFWSTEPVSLYNVSGIPYNFLVDPNGNIIAENIRGEELFSTLSDVLK